MRNKEFKKMFKEEFKKENSCKVTLEDVLPETELKTYNDNIFQKYKRQQRLTKYFALNSLITVLVLIISIIGFTIKLEDFKSHQNNYPTLSTEAKEFMIDYCGGYDGFKLVSHEYLYDNQFISIYSSILRENNQYFECYFYFTNVEISLLFLNFNNSDVATINHDRFGILGVVDYESDNDIILKIEYKNLKRIISIENEK